MNAAVGDQPLDRFLGDLAAVRVEAREDDRPRRVVDDEIHAGGLLERADVAALAADDTALEVVARQIDHGHRRFDRVLGAAALNGFRDVLLGAIDGDLARLGVETLEEVGGIVARLALDLFDENVLRFVGRQAGDPLQLVFLLGHELVVLRGRGGRGLLALAQPAVARVQLPLQALDGGLALGDRGVAPVERLFEGGRLLAVLARLPLGIHQEIVGALLGFEERLFLAGLGVALGVLRDAERLLLGAADGFGGEALAVGDPYREERGRDDRGHDGGDDQADEYLLHA